MKKKLLCFIALALSLTATITAQVKCDNKQLQAYVDYVEANVETCQELEITGADEQLLINSLLFVMVLNYAKTEYLTDDFKAKLSENDKKIYMSLEEKYNPIILKAKYKLELLPISEQQGIALVVFSYLPSMKQVFAEVWNAAN